jgi:hypothetical protein
MSASTQKGYQQAALRYLNTADSLVLLTDIRGLHMPSDSLWCGIQRAGAKKPDVHNDSTLMASRAALNQKQKEENKRIAVRNRIYGDGRAQWQKHLAKRNDWVQYSGQAVSFAAGIILLAAIVLFKPQLT